MHQLDPAALLRRATELSRAIAGTTAPNPAVGCVITDATGTAIFGEGATQPPGGHHAEIEALLAAGAAAYGGCAYVTLEPCNHTGRTGPCAEALLQAGIAELHYIHSDPNPVASGGAERLRSAGVKVVQHGQLRSEPLVPWLLSTRLGRAHITLKVAHTLDGFTAAEDGTSQWITGAVARRRVHADRARRDAIVVGTGTVLADNPRLNARPEDGGEYSHQPEPIVVGSRALPEHSHLAQRGAHRCASIPELLDYLSARGHVDVLVEGGASLAGSLLRAGLVDALESYTAPTLLGSGRGISGGGLARTISEQKRFVLESSEVLGADVLLIARSPQAHRLLIDREE
ncbi:Riboflavin biosynthesis protein RibD [Corynebacterium ciconiae DSM 44920]|uniref:bifunctional diaminohydroxyphosphoribosylaminopyrimidine deaminase/5-amino-6-(5-phosphoribosylamino)uracil reductase RibD n=1 Tax=Corynebacterium ciconiae TaxID=227319 RepID=UPI00036C493B|nr:bifunctional diaminohydroxyphosphoribosylaminopyrimidine deaminase/5-amino-6-(5-phosphoribosylamino)uracil reductase RibD [Corynebacterium ciconiae]WKD61261.1 Riboflavin biosynthesis protein RibD [Corynebacterium ciconiae DSM 44920]